MGFVGFLAVACCSFHSAGVTAYVAHVFSRVGVAQSFQLTREDEDALALREKRATSQEPSQLRALAALPQGVATVLHTAKQKNRKSTI